MTSFFRRLFHKGPTPIQQFTESMKQERITAELKTAESQAVQQQVITQHATGNFIADRLRGITDEGAKDAYLA